MGIPTYFRYLLLRHKDILSVQKNNLTFDYFFLDLNSVLYEVYRTETENFQKNQRYFYRKIVEELVLLCNEIIKPQKMIYFALDGPAPRAKMVQQRSRRYKSIQFSSLVGTTEDGWNPSNNICPGTQFMHDLSKFILTSIQQKKFHCPKVVLDDASHPGEGEHKILPIIRKLKGRNDGVIIMSPDNDLLSLGILTGKSNVYVLRYMDKFCSEVLRVDLDKAQRQMVFISVDKIQQHFCNEQEKLFGKSIDTDNLLLDYNFLLSMVGNDFVSSLPYMKIKSGGLDKLIQIYNTVHHSEKKFLVDKNTLRINLSFFTELVRQLACMENNEMKNLSGFIQREMYHGRPMKDEDKLSKEKVFENRLNHLYLCNPHHPLYEEYKDEFTKINYTSPKNEWKGKYYQNFCHVDPQNYREYNALRSKIVQKYLESLIFTLHYYNRECPSWTWYYPFRVAPLFSDVYTNLTKLKFDLNEIRFQLGTPYTPFQQLMLILPPQSKHILPTDFHHLFQKYSSFYPSSFRIDALQGMKYIYSEAILPEMHSSLQFIGDVQKVERKLKQKERERNMISKGVYKFSF